MVGNRQRKHDEDILGVNLFATAEDLKSAFRAAALCWHPDRNPGDPDAAKKFIEIKAAFERLVRDHNSVAWSDVVVVWPEQELNPENDESINDYSEEPSQTSSTKPQSSYSGVASPCSIDLAAGILRLLNRVVLAMLGSVIIGLLLRVLC